MLTEERKQGLNRIQQIEQQLSDLLNDLHADSDAYSDDEHMSAAIKVLKSNVSEAKSKASMLIFSPTFSDFNYKN